MCESNFKLNVKQMEIKQTCLMNMHKLFFTNVTGTCKLIHPGI